MKVHPELKENHHSVFMQIFSLAMSMNADYIKAACTRLPRRVKKIPFERFHLVTQSPEPVRMKMCTFLLKSNANRFRRQFNPDAPDEG